MASIKKENILIKEEKIEEGNDYYKYWVLMP